jgi:hypothetical protein
MGISGFQQALTPNLDALVREGALSLGTRSVMPTVSAPNWGSHLLGAGPEQHGITSNGWTTTNHTIEPVTADPDGYFPSVFSVIRNQKPDAITGFFYDWDALADLYNTSVIDKVEFSKRFDESFEKATPWVITEKPDFTFIYIGHPDEEGHNHQWGSEEYLRAIEDVDAALGRFFDALREAGLYEDTHFIVVSDHGGVGYSHGGLTMEEMLTPWIISGPGIIADRMIGQPNDVMNTAATIAFLFRLEPPYEWTGRPVIGAFENHPVAAWNNRSYVPQPFASISSGMYDESQAVAFVVSDPGARIRFTVDGSDPGMNSPEYSSPVLLQKNTLLKAVAIREVKISRVTAVDFVKVLKVKQIELANNPDEKYLAGGPLTLVDRQTGSGQYNDGKWLGFKGNDLIASLLFDDRLNVSRVSVGILNNPGSWIFPPERIRVLASVDGMNYTEIGSFNRADRIDPIKSGRYEISVKITPALTRFLKVEVYGAGVCPPGHPGEGDPAWLFVDEIIVE